VFLLSFNQWVDEFISNAPLRLNGIEQQIAILSFNQWVDEFISNAPLRLNGIEQQIAILLWHRIIHVENSNGNCFSLRI